MRRIGSYVLLSAVVLVSLAACGGGGSSSLSKADFIAKSDAVCKDLNDKGNNTGQPKDAKETATLIDSLLTSARSARAKLAALKPPSDGQQLQKDMLAQFDTQLAAGDRAKAIAQKGDMQGAIDEMSKIDTSAMDKRLSDYGFKDCSNSGTGDPSGASGN